MAAGDAGFVDGLAGDSPAVFPWLEATGATAWLNTAAAFAAAAAAGRALTGPSADSVRRVHDKAFAHEAAGCEGLMPPDLADTIAIIEPETLRDPAVGIAAVQRHLDRWPPAARRSFTLKPRLGCSGRGRAAGRDGWADDPAFANALPRLAACGGALLEPWLNRGEDLSASLWIAPNGELTLLGTSEQITAPSGLYRGQRGNVDSKGRITSDSDRDEGLRAAAAALAPHVVRAGFTGACGLDAFTYRSADGRASFRPVVEWNARFTLGTIVIGLVKRARESIRASFAPGPERRLAFHFRLDAPAGGWPESDPELLVVRYFEPEDPVRPALVVAPDRATLDARLGDAG
jgi:hypothetical protein